MKLFRSKGWNWWDALLLKWSSLLFGTALGAYFHEALLGYLWVLLVAAMVLAIRPAIAYFRE